MIVKVSELTGAALDYGVILAKVPRAFENKPSIKNIVKNYPYSTSWTLAGPIIEREKIDIRYVEPVNEWHADTDSQCESGPTPLIAAMLCYVASKLGDEIEIPDQLK